MSIAQSAIVIALSTTHHEASKHSMKSSGTGMRRITILSHTRGGCGSLTRGGAESKVIPTGNKKGVA